METCLPPPGEVLEEVVKVEKAGEPTRYIVQPAFPGAMDDWFTFLAKPPPDPWHVTHHYVLPVPS